MKRNTRNIDIILSWRIGDAVLTIPVLMCLHQLNEKYNSNYSFNIYTQPFLNKIFKPLDLFKCEKMNLKSKIKSLFCPSDKAFFLETTSKNFGFNTKDSYGNSNPFKRHLSFNNEAKYLDRDRFNEFLPEKLVSFLKNDCLLSAYSITLFGVCLDLGYSVEQIIDTFEFETSKFNLDNFEEKHSICGNDDYIVFCKEAAYGRKGTEHRIWGDELYYEVAEKCYKEFNLKSIVIGVNREDKLPDAPYLIDTRGTLNLFELAQIMRGAKIYFGNDTGPLHIFNLMQRQSLSLYFDTEAYNEFAPIFPHLNTKFYKPQDTDEICNRLREVLNNEELKETA